MRSASSWTWVPLARSGVSISAIAAAASSGRRWRATVRGGQQNSDSLVPSKVTTATSRGIRTPLVQRKDEANPLQVIAGEDGIDARVLLEQGMTSGVTALAAERHPDDRAVGKAG